MNTHEIPVYEPWQKHITLADKTTKSYRLKRYTEILGERSVMRTIVTEMEI